MTTCPHCGNPLQIVAPQSRGRGATFGSDWQINTGRTFYNAVPAIATLPSPPPGGGRVREGGEPQFAEARRETPARPASVESDVLVPGAQALATGIALIVPGIALTVWLQLPWWAPLAIGGAGITITWMILLGAHRKMMWIIETITNRDLDGDGTTGSPEPERVTLEVKQPSAHGTNYKLIDLPAGVTSAMLTAFAERYKIRGLSQSAWAGGGNPFSRSQYDAFMAALQTAGIVQWKNPHERAQGRIVTHAGRAALKYLAHT